MSSFGDEAFKDYQQPAPRPLLIIAIVALVVVVVAACIGIFLLYRVGAFDELLAATTPEPTATSIPPTVAVTPTDTPQPTILVVTATPNPTAVPTTPAVTLAPTITALASATPELSATPTEESGPLAGTFTIEYLGCEPHGSDIGSVKGQVFDSEGNVIPDAYVWITLNGWPYDTPARSNGAGWYEFFLEKGLKVKIVSVVIAGEEVELVGNEDLEFKAQGGCFEHVNIREQ
ncbi:MAG: hypothetical protein ACP5G7_08840 [Anaerolineae bacterium]